jgi:hypothetical protein
MIGNNCITISALLRVHGIDGALLYDITAEVIEIEKNKMEVYQSTNDAKAYVKSMRKVCYCERLLSIFRVDALEALRLRLRHKSVDN